MGDPVARIDAMVGAVASVAGMAWFTPSWGVAVDGIVSCGIAAYCLWRRS